MSLKVLDHCVFASYQIPQQQQTEHHFAQIDHCVRTQQIQVHRGHTLVQRGSADYHNHPGEGNREVGRDMTQRLIWHLVPELTDI